MEYVVTTALRRQFGISRSRKTGKFGAEVRILVVPIYVCYFAILPLIIRVDSKRRTPPNLSLLSGFRLLFTLHPPPQKAILSCSISTFRSSSILSTSYFI